MVAVTMWREDSGEHRALGNRRAVGLTPPPTELTTSAANLAKKPAISVLLPCFNESAVVDDVLLATEAVLQEACPGDFEIIAVDDGSSDGTGETAERLATSHPEISVLRHVHNHGKGSALREAFLLTRGDVVCFLDGDFDIHPRHIPDFLKILREDSTQVVIGSKRHPDSRIEYPRRRRVLSRGYETFVHVLFGLNVSDTQAGIKMFRREVLERVFTKGLVKRYAFDVEVLALAQHEGFRIQEAPIALDSWEKIGSNVNFAEVVRMFFDTLGIFYRLKVTKYYDHVGPSPITGRGA